MIGLTLRNVSKRFGEVVAIDGLNLDIEPGSFLTLLGPSGCGKTTALRCIAGLEEPDEGEIRIGDKVVFSSSEGLFVPPGQRGVGLVFQSYAVWPHMTVFENIAFGLELQKLPRTEIADRVAQSLADLKMDGMEGRYPHELSGGQQQRVAVARMLAARPDVFLMDEPLSNLDARLRTDMRSELKRLHHTVGATTVYVTHDQLEAMTMSSQIAVMCQGKLFQVGTPDEIYRQPANLFVADFVGSPKINLLEATVRTEDGQPRLDFGFFSISYPALPAIQEVVAAIRPEDIVLSLEPVPDAVELVIYSVLPAGSELIVQAQRDEVLLTIKETRRQINMDIDQPVWLRFDPDSINLYDKRTEQLLKLK